MDKKGFGKIGVLAGGPSSERQISLRSGRAVHNALIQEGLDAIFLDVCGNVCDIIRNNKIDAAFIALHGKLGEDGTVQRILEELKIPYTGSGVEASQLALDKIASKDMFSKRGIPSPKYTVVKKSEPKPQDIAGIGYPIVIKPQFEGSSIGLSIVREKGDMKEALDKAFRYGEKILIEEYIDGRELTVGILDDQPLPVIEIVTKNKVYDYTAKYEDPETKYLVPAPVDKRCSDMARDLAGRAHCALGCRSFSRVDMMMDASDNIYVLEVNTIPGMTERSLLPKAAQAVGLSFNQLCLRLIENAMRTKK